MSMKVVENGMSLRWRVHRADLHFLEDGELADLHDVLHLDALDRLALLVEAVDAQEGPVHRADPEAHLGVGAVVVRARAWPGRRRP